MLLESLIYFLDCGSIIQLNNNLKKLSVEVNYSDDMLFHFLDNNLYLNICKSWVNYLDDKSLLQTYLLKYSHDVEWIKLLITFYPEINHRYRNDKLLPLCGIHGHLEVVKWLVNNGTDIRVSDYQPLQYACEYGHLETAKYLLSLIDTDEEKKLCVQSSDNYALRLSAMNGHFEIVKLLINSGANIRVNDYESFRYACAYGHLETAEYLLSLINTDEERKLCVQSADNYALIWSAKDGHIEVIKWLVNNAGNIRVNNYQPFQFACEHGHLETAKYLFNLIDDMEQKKQCIHVHDDHALRWSAKFGHLDVVEWLVNNGADVRSENYEAFRFSCQYGHLETAKYLFDLISCEEEEKKLCIQSEDNCALRWSAKFGHLDVVEWLVNNGADVRSENYEPFRFACMYGYLETAKHMLNSIDHEEEEKKLCIKSGNNCALRWSAKFGYLDVVRWLVNNGADVRSEDYEAIRFSEEREVRDYLLDQLSEEERMEIVDSLN